MAFKPKAVLFDMDGVITDTARAHQVAWKRMFDDYLASLEGDAGKNLSPFTVDDYLRFVDGMPRYDGVRCFLQSRGIQLDEGTPADPPAAETICGLGNRKNEYFNTWLAQQSVDVYPGTLRLIDALEAAGIRRGVFSSSRNAEAVLASGKVRDRFEVVFDGNEQARRGIPGKPDPALLLAAARALEAEPEATVIVEDAISGVEAGRRGGFGLVIGIAREGPPAALQAAGADIVVGDLAEIGLDEQGCLVAGA